MSRARRNAPAAERGRSLTAGPLPERVACVWLPQFAVCAERARRPSLAGRPLALVGAGERPDTAVIRACSAEASMAGLAVGAPAHTIPQRCPGAVILPFDAPHYAERYEEMILALDAVSPVIEAHPPEAFYLDLTGLPHLDADAPEAVAAAVRARVPEAFSLRLGIASGKFTAWVAANRATAVRPMPVSDEEKPAFLRPASSALLPASEAIHRQLNQMGLRTLGRIAGLPRSAMLSRFGWPGERLHRLACGEDREPLHPYRAAPVVREVWGFTYPPTTVHFYLALQELIFRAWGRPERGDRGVRQVRLEAALEDGEVWERRFTLRQPTERPEHAFSELRRRLEGGMPVGALRELSIELGALAPRLEGQRLLFQDERVERREKLKDALDHLRGRLRIGGRPAVYRIVEVDPWALLPEESYGLVRYDP